MYTFKSMAKSRIVKLDAQQTKDVNFTIQTPNNKFPGMIMGGFFIYDNNTGVQAGSVAIPVWLTQTNKAVGGVLLLHNIQPRPVNQQPYLYVNLSNTQPGMMKNVVVHMKVQHRGFMEWLGFGLKPMTADLNYKNVAPNSALPVAFNQKSTPISAGKYRVTGTATAGKVKWKFSNDFTISKKEADAVNKKCKGLVYDYTWAYLLAVAGLVLLIIIVIFFVWRSTRYRPRHLRKRGHSQSLHQVGTGGQVSRRNG